MDEQQIRALIERTINQFQIDDYTARLAYQDEWQDKTQQLQNEFEALKAECHNFADEWLRKIEALESTVDPIVARAELASLLAKFVKESR